MTGSLSLWGLFLGESCDTSGEEYWGWISYPLVMLYCFYLLAQICDGHLNVALEHIVERLKLSEDVAGATFLAMASSAPELFCSVLATFVLVSAVGVGNIIGSAVFNLLVIIGVVPIFASGTLHIWWYPTVRDAAFYAVAIAEVAAAMADGLVYWYESLIMVITYFIYVTYIVHNARICKHFGFVRPEKEDGSAGSGVIATTPVVPFPTPAGDDEAPVETAPAEEDEADRRWCRYEPVMMLIDATMPTRPEAVFVMFGLCCFWVASLTYFAVDAAERMGCLVSMPDVVMGLVFLAAGTSVPDAMGSIAVAKDGMGDMAVANAVGSNTFDILMGLGMPWFLKGAWTNKPIEVPTESLMQAVVILACSLFFYLCMIRIHNWRLDRRLGIVLLVMYGLIISWILIRHYAKF